MMYKSYNVEADGDEIFVNAFEDNDNTGVSGIEIRLVVGRKTLMVNVNEDNIDSLVKAIESARSQL